MLRGLDVSSVQGAVAWDAVAKQLGCRFAFVKCSEGNRGKDPIFNTPSMFVDAARASSVTGRDPMFTANVAGAKGAGLYVGPYHFAYPLPADGTPLRNPADQAKYAFDCAGGLGEINGDLPPMLDFEWPPPEQWQKWGCSAEQLKQWALDYLHAAEGYWGCKPILYTYPDFWRHLQADGEPFFPDYPLCMASYPHVARWPVDGENPIALPPWNNWMFWQWTGGGMRMPNGAPGDFQVFHGDEAALAALCQVTQS